MQPAPSAKRHLLVFAVVVFVLFIVVALFNRYLFKVIAASTNQKVLQNSVGWERTYKPIIFDELKPKVAVFGASWARDAFDYEEMTLAFGREFFNFAASGGQPYENLRFLQSALAAGSLDTVILNLDSFSAYQRRPPTSYGFNEGILNVHPDGSANGLATWHRLFATTLSGAALASNFSSLKLLKQAQSGLPKQELLRAYDRFDYKGAADGMVQLKEQIFRPKQSDLSSGPKQTASIQEVQIQKSYLGSLEAALTSACQAKVKVYAYLTPHHAAAFRLEPANEYLLARKLALLQAVRQARDQCQATHSALEWHYFDFQYPNRVSLEGVLAPIEKAIFYRSDLHPRPTVGQLMAAKMIRGVSEPQDFGVDLLSLSEEAALGWTLERHKRWFGVWADSALKSLTAAQ